MRPSLNGIFLSFLGVTFLPAGAFAGDAGEPLPKSRPLASKPDLRKDRFLQEPVTVRAKDPKLNDLLRALQKATGWALTVDPALQNHDPAFGSLQLGGVPAVRLMELIAQHQLVDGYWEETREGYRLRAKASLRQKSAPSPGGQAPRAPQRDPFYLRKDPKLFVVLHLGSDPPKLSGLMQALREATHLSLTLADTLETHDPDFGKVTFSTTPRAWQVMELLARTQLQEGHWEKTENGYRLTGVSLSPQRPSTNVLVVVLLWLLPGAAILGLSGLYLRKRRSAQAAVEPNPQAPSRPGNQGQEPGGA